MARRFVLSLITQGPKSSTGCWTGGRAAANSALGAIAPELPCAVGSTHALQQQQQYHNSSSSSTFFPSHICSSSCGCITPSAQLIPQGAAALLKSFSPSLSSSSSRVGGAWRGWRSLPVDHSPVRRGFASVSLPSAHAGCGHSHHHDEPCDEATAQIQQAQDMQQLQQLVQQGSSSMTAGQTAAAFRRAAVLADKTPDAAAPVVDLLAPIWPRVLPEAVGKDLADALLSWTKLQTRDEALWSPTLAAVPAQIKEATGQDLANVAYALAAMSGTNGGIPGVPRPEVQELLRAVTEEVVSLVSGKPGGEEGSVVGGDSSSSSNRSVSVGNLATVRWAHEVFDEVGSNAAG